MAKNNYGEQQIAANAKKTFITDTKSKSPFHLSELARQIGKSANNTSVLLKCALVLAKRALVKDEQFGCNRLSHLGRTNELYLQTCQSDRPVLTNGKQPNFYTAVQPSTTF